MSSVCHDPRAALRTLDGQALAMAPEHVARVVGARAPVAPGRRTQGVAVVPVFGLIEPRSTFALQVLGGTPLDAFRRTMAHLAAESSVGTIVLVFDSPGGSVYGVEEAAMAVADAAARKRVVAIADSLMASAAYWIASEASEIVATPSSEVGSVGVFTMHFDFSERLAQQGVRTTVITSSAHKAEGTRYHPLSDGARSHVQSTVDAYGSMFERRVARGRAVSLATVRERFGQGRTYTADEARRRGMVDRIATLDTVLDELAGGASRRTPSATVGHAAAATASVSAAERPDWAAVLAAATDEDRAQMRRTAIHEAGHTVLAVLEDVGVREVSLDTRVENGRVIHQGGTTRPAMREKRLPSDVMLAAGYAAVVRAGFDPIVEQRNARDDWRQVHLVQRSGLFAGTGLKRGMWPEHAIQAAKRWFDADWTTWYAVLDVAGALEARGYLSGAEAEAIVRARLPDYMVGIAHRTHEKRCSRAAAE